MAVLRQVVRDHKDMIRSCSTYNGNCFVYTLPSPNAPATAKTIKTEINTIEALENFCSNFVKKPLKHFLDILAAKPRGSRPS